MWRGLETGEGGGGGESGSWPSQIHSICTVNTPILYLSCNTICKKKVI